MYAILIVGYQTAKFFELKTQEDIVEFVSKHGDKNDKAVLINSSGEIIDYCFWNESKNKYVREKKTSKLNKINGIMIERLESKKAALKARQMNFLNMCNNDFECNCFERNAINELLYIQQLKSEIKELQHYTFLIKPI